MASGQDLTETACEELGSETVHLPAVVAEFQISGIRAIHISGAIAGC